jgi:2-dehydro-3-deoxygalactonokinase
MNQELFIAIEWGTARLKASLLDSNGAILDTIEKPVRLAHLDREDMAALVAELAHRWPSTKGPMLLAGMIGSSIGWHDVAHLPCPVTFDMIGGGLSHHEMNSHRVVIIPGLKCTSRFGDFEVMRGEEVLAAGLAASEPLEDILLLSAPGMHGKWIEIGCGAVTRFHTSMTVELLSLIAENSFLAPAMKSPPSVGPAFFKGVERGLEGGGLGRLLFTARTGEMAGQFNKNETASYVWGILIGSDLREIETVNNRSIYLSGSKIAVELFSATLSHMNLKSKTISTDEAFAVGFSKIQKLL